MNTCIVIPTYNEVENISLITRQIFELPVENLHILNVDDGSPDGTGVIADRLRGEHPGRFDCIHRTGRRGLGLAYLEGFRKALASGADVIGQMDADLSHPVGKIKDLIAALETCDVAIGSRYVPGGSLDHAWSPFRKRLSGFGNWYARSILRIPVQDVTGGFKFWKRAALEKLPLDAVRSNGYVFQVEMNYLAYRLGCRFAEIPIHFAERERGRSKMSLRIQIEAAFQVWALLWRHARV